MPRNYKLTAGQLVDGWLKEQQRILETLDPKLLARYRELDGCIKAVNVAEAVESARQRKSDQSTGPCEAEPPHTWIMPAYRTPLSEHKKKLIEFLSKNSRCTRSFISRETGIPLGSLSALLKD